MVSSISRPSFVTSVYSGPHREEMTPSIMFHICCGLTYVWLIGWNSGFPRPCFCTLTLTTNEGPLSVAETDLNVGGGSGVELCVLVMEIDDGCRGLLVLCPPISGPSTMLCMWICYHCGVESVPPVGSRQCRHTHHEATPLKDPPVEKCINQCTLQMIFRPHSATL